MSRLAFKSAVYHGYLRLGELDAVPANGDSFQFPNNEIRIHHISPISERCHPLSILQTVSSFSVRCKLEPSSAVEQANLISLHDSCLQEFKCCLAKKKYTWWQCRVSRRSPRAFGASPFLWVSTTPLWDCSIYGASRSCLISTRHSLLPTQ
ncbi:RNA polymerase II C-terminal domain phosphatase-like 2 isoform X2 [Syzygium oleosum]|uniref:RNA polymerase II C-terminal domain phosphatase-like 2 isoform X2 n=1 Tax=Syzygium oleosum TaxID=219896 RepID=UPI0024BABEE8|nr:RNA polymerase II C-terminal domain phosphatase-like 2 isoform X2 [Syzygium oleosum]